MFQACYTIFNAVIRQITKTLHRLTQADGPLETRHSSTCYRANLVAQVKRCERTYGDPLVKFGPRFPSFKVAQSHRN